MTKTHDIIKLFNDGNSFKEIVSRGYKRGTVFAARREWRQGMIRKRTGDDKTTASGATCSTDVPSTQPDIESDPEIVELKKQIRKADLEKQLSMAKAPSEIEVLIAAAKEFGKDRQRECQYLGDGACVLRIYSSEDEIPPGIGETVCVAKDTWQIKPSPLFCAMCTENIHSSIEWLHDSLKNVPIYDIKERFSCECGTKGMLAVSVKCTKCGQESWWGWWPKE